MPVRGGTQAAPVDETGASMRAAIKDHQPVCPYCKGASRHRFSSADVNQKSSQDLFHYFICSSCSLTFIERIPEDLGRYYINEQYDIPSDRSKFLPRVQSQLWKVDLLKTLVAPGTLFEVGPATGEFAFAARQSGFSPKLAEMDEKCGRFLREELELSVVRTSDPAGCLAQELKYDAICIWQAIEHIPEFWNLLNVAVDHIAKGGVLVISTPNPNSVQARMLGRYWPHLDAPRHLYLIPQDWFRSFARERGLPVVLDTTRDVGSIGLNYYGWYIAVRNSTSKVLPDRCIRGAAKLITGLLRYREDSEGKGCSYTIALRRT